jgi:hypothetical protein
MSWYWTPLQIGISLNPSQFCYFHCLQTLNMYITDCHHCHHHHPSHHMGKNLFSTGFVYVKFVKYNLKDLHHWHVWVYL